MCLMYFEIWYYYCGYSRISHLRHSDEKLFLSAHEQEQRKILSYSTLHLKLLCTLLMTSTFICNYAYVSLSISRQSCRYSQL